MLQPIPRPVSSVVGWVEYGSPLAGEGIGYGTYEFQRGGKPALRVYVSPAYMQVECVPPPGWSITRYAADGRIDAEFSSAEPSQADVAMLEDLLHKLEGSDGDTSAAVAALCNKLRPVIADMEYRIAVQHQRGAQ